MPGHKRSILVVDDEYAQRLLLASVLEGSYDVATAACASEAIHELKRRTFDLIITDQLMPVSTGLELLRWTRGHFPLTPIIVLTGASSTESAGEAATLGACEYLSKPLKDPQQLRLAVARSLGES